MNRHNAPFAFLKGKTRHGLIVITAVASIAYLIIISFFFPPGNKILFGLLIGGEIFHTWQALSYLFTVWKLNTRHRFDSTFTPAIDVFITVAGEPVDIVEETVRAAVAMDYPYHRVFILNDGYVAKKDNWEDIELLASHLGVECITRKTAGGAKAGNINNALAQTSSPLVVVFDADHIPHKDFLQKTVPYFVDERMGFVQSPQFYRNASYNLTTQAAWEQQELFYGPICRGKDASNSVPICGTNMVMRRSALDEVGGIFTETITEDFATGLFLHSHGWKSAYVPEVLAEGLAPEDFLSYSKQQYRWARGSLDVIFRLNLLFRRGLTWRQRLQYLSSVSFFFTGLITLIDMMLPVIFFYTGLIPIAVSSMLLAAVFIPYILLMVYTISITSNYRFTYNALSFSVGGFWIHLKALWGSITRQKTGFVITEKRAVEGNFISLVEPHLTYIAIVAIGLPIAVMREGLSPSVVNNLAWSIVNIGIFVPFIRAAVPQWSWKDFLRPQTLSRAKATIIALITFTWFR